jgi:hypothetical protein
MPKKREIFYLHRKSVAKVVEQGLKKAKSLSIGN